MAKTLTEGLKPASIADEVIHKNYFPLLSLVKELIGVIPNCNPTLEIWPPGFRTYNLLVPNLFNLPQTLFGSKSFKASMGLAMYASSRAACAYCTAHCCSFALRRGARADAFSGSLTAREQAVVTLAEGLASIPAQLTLTDLEAIHEYFSPSKTEWLVFSVSMMGFLNKLMDALGVELEQGVINEAAELLAPTGWDPALHAGSGYRVTETKVPSQDNLMTFLTVIRHAPGAIRWEKEWTRGVPARYPQAAEYLKNHTGYSFPIIKPVSQSRVIRTLSAVLRDNVSKEQTQVGLKIKMYAACIYSTLVPNETLSSEVKSMVAHVTPELNAAMFDKLIDLSLMEIPTDSKACKEAMISLQQQSSFSEKEAAALLLAVAASHTPAQLNESVIETVLSHLAAAEVVEIVVWLSVLQLLNRMSNYYSLINAY